MTSPMQRTLSKKRIRQNKILADPMVQEIDRQIVKVFNISIPKMLFIKNKHELVIEYSKETKALVKEFEGIKLNYIKEMYGVEDDK